MKPGVSVYLDLVRFAAALVVMVGHLSGQRFTAGLMWQFGGFMSEAVAVFFVLSGFVIAYAVAGRRDGSAAGYALDRAARIYSVALPALLLTFAMDAWGRAVRPELYSIDWGYQASGRLVQLVSGVFFVNQLWGLKIPQGSALPYWSLGYEVWYYVAFGVAWYARGLWRAGLLAAVLVVVGPGIAALFPLWLMGAGAYWLVSRVTLPRWVGGVLWVGSMGAWVGYEVMLRPLVPALPGFAVPDAIEFYAAGLLFTLNLVGLDALIGAGRFGGDGWLAGGIRYLAGATFTIYLLHLPVAQLLAALTPYPPGSATTRVIVLGGTLAVTFMIAAVTERRKRAWRRAIGGLVPAGWRRGRELRAGPGGP